MKRMTEKMAQQMLTFFADRLDINNLPPDDVATFELFQRADTDGRIDCNHRTKPWTDS